MASGWISRTTRETIYRSDAEACIYCGATEENSGMPLTLDHIQCRVAGGGHAPSNLLTCCYHCNSSRQETPMPRWLRRLEKAGADVVAIKSRIALAVRRHRALETRIAAALAA
jgi:5-methylcytosine-specific restriction endonuclease McrA